MSVESSLERAGFAVSSRDSGHWMRLADIMAIFTAVALPWSTSLVAIFIVIFLLALTPTFERRSFIASLSRPAIYLPVVFFLLAVAGTLWASAVPWPARLHGIGPVVKLLAIPVLIHHFQRSDKGPWVLVAFLASCTALMLLSWLMVFDPRLVFDASKTPGVPVKNYIAQSQEFTLCAFAGAGAAILLLRKRAWWPAVILLCLSAAFLADMVLIISSRTALVSIPVLLLLIAARYFGFKAALALILVSVTVGVLAWASLPNLRARIDSVSSEYQNYREKNESTSTGMRLEFWRKSVKFIQRSPVWGNGTGATKELFTQDAVGQTGVSAEVIGNPHNQTLNAAVQWGLLGVIVLYAMWISHLFLFTSHGVAAWTGLVAVVENVLSSIFNSHLFDFHEGWMYVLAVGVAGGVVLRRQRHEDAMPADADGPPPQSAATDISS